MKNKILISIYIVLLLSQLSRAQNQCSFCQELKNNVVQIKTTLSDGSDENGFGTVISEVSNKLYIVTAKHVIYRLDGRGLISDEAKPTAVKVRFFKDQGKVYTATALQLKSNNLDITLLEVNKPQNFRWTKEFYSKAITTGKKVWFIGRAQDWYVPTGAAVGSVNDISSNDEIIMDINSIQPGTSGAPLISSDGIVGLIYEDSPTGSRAYAIEKVIKVITRDWRYEWQMTLNSNITQPEISDAEDKAWVEIVKEKKSKNKIEQLSDYVSKNQGSHVDDAKVQLEGLLFADIQKPKYQELYVKHFPAGPHISEVENIVWKTSSTAIDDFKYTSYLQLFPTGKYYERASKEREKIDAGLKVSEEDKLYADVKEARVFAIKNYFEKYPQGRYLGEIDEILWTQALKDETKPAFKEDGFEEYLKYFPKGKHASTALQKVRQYKRN